MILIAHRGLLEGPNPQIENHPDQIDLALSLGYDCEIDLWVLDDKFYLGHDGPQHAVSLDYISKPNLWIHAKNLDALYFLARHGKLNYFWHQEDDFTLTSSGYIWTYPGKPLTLKSIMVLPEWTDSNFERLSDTDCFGICSDYVYRISTLIGPSI